MLSDRWEGSYGTYNLNEVGVAGAQGFLLERPGRVVGAQVQWNNLADAPAPVPLQFWPDFGSDGYMWDLEAPIAEPFRCLSAADEGTWVDYVLDEPIVVSQPLHVFAGYEKERGADTPAILQEDFWYEGDLPHAGVRFLGVDDELYYLGLASPWYTWRIRLAVIYDDDILPADKPFRMLEAEVDDMGVSASSRVAWGDYDNDGDDDLMTSGPALWRNDGGTFTDVSATALPAGVGASGGVWGDYDNDGCLDFFGQGTSYTTGDLLLHNACDGTFDDVTLESGIHDIQSERDCDGDGTEEHSPTEGSGWTDVDNDGWLDLYMANYECSSEHDYFQNYDDRLWRNNGDGTFTDWTETAGVPTSNEAGRGVTVGDYDLDGDIDVFVSNYRLDRNFFLVNEGDGTLTNEANGNGTEGTLVNGAYGHTIGAVFGDIDNDGDFDMVHANLAHPFFYHFSDKSGVMMNDGSGVFTDEAASRGLYYRETHSNPSLFDADNDGDLDLFITSVYRERDSDFYENDGTGHFTLRNFESGLVQQNGWGAAVADPDGDGDLDLVAYQLFENEPATAHGWVKVTAVGGAGAGGLANRSAIGAVVMVTSALGDQMRMVSGGSGTGVQDSLTQHVGLGDDDRADRVTVWFPGGASVSVDDVLSGSRLWIHEDGRTSMGTVPPEW
ncbi:MAG: hypothetical protein CL927_03975 [Deltaproteobacteria bacterium]|nr:hypothetical protein [Deltaproteobacteria bacterium]